jgi:NADP-dependent alcohol dehydrogenase
VNNFIFSNPTRIIFGKGSIADIPKYLPKGARILLTYGRNSIKQNGVYDLVYKALTNFTMFEFGGIEPNPSYETCIKAVDIIRKEEVDFLLAVGGGSVLDATKFIALALFYTASNDPWDFMAGRKPGPTVAVPIGSVMTLPATGSEMNSGLVISRESTQEKLSYSSYAVYPKFSILDPEVSYSLPPHQVTNGIVDTFVHVIEQYITYPTYAPLQDRQAEALLATIIEEAPKVLADRKNYDSRATLMWCATQALNGVISRGVPQDWATHGIGVEITALYGLDHASTLAIVLCGLWVNQFENKKAKLSQYGRRIWNMHGDDDTVAKDAIAKTEAFFESIGVPTRFSGYGLNGIDVAEKISMRFAERGLKGLGEHQSVGIEQIRAILADRA